MQPFLQNNVDPRQELIPRPPPIDGDLPDGNIPTGDVGFESSNFLGDLWASIFGGNEFWAWLFGGGLFGVLAWLWSIYTFIAYLLSLIFIILYIYATIRKEYYEGLIAQRVKDEHHIWNHTYGAAQKQGRLDDIQQHALSDNPNDWKLAIIEADIILDQTLKDRGYAGTSLGERLRSITPRQLSSIDDAWDAHRVRNKIAHEGADFVVTRRIVDETIARYLRVFREFGVE
jgi:hypothetical protein